MLPSVRGAAYVKSDKIEYFDAPKVKVVDTTGAGDAFVGTFAHAIGMLKSPEEAIRLAIEKSSLSVTKKELSLLIRPLLNNFC
ncbi:MAG: hypothetical protein CM15mP96_2630 [Gammaproteobacteria bacterium]|nr:MAG: hypothetical protein CM15mP96_2630 [Gammaproteobacteria bacterium]